MSADPYRPHPRPIPNPSALPTGRLRRIGVTTGVMRLLEKGWRSLDGDQRKGMADRWAVLTDQELRMYVTEIQALHGAAMAVISEWVEEQPDQQAAAKIAATVESSRDRPRQNLLNKLEKLASA